MEKREIGVYTIAKVQNITKQHAYRVCKKYKKIQRSERTYAAKVWKAKKRNKRGRKSCSTKSLLGTSCLCSVA